MSWKHVKLARDWKSRYHSRDDELPQKAGQSKYLFIATRYEPGSRAMVDAEIELSILRLREAVSVFEGPSVLNHHAQ